MLLGWHSEQGMRSAVFTQKFAVGEHLHFNSRSYHTNYIEAGMTLKTQETQVTAKTLILANDIFPGVVHSRLDFQENPNEGIGHDVYLLALWNGINTTHASMERNWVINAIEPAEACCFHINPQV